MFRRLHVVVSMEGWRKRPSLIRDHQDQEWTVLELVEYRQHRDYKRHGKVLGQYGAEARRYILRVRGPLPRRGGGSGEQHVAIRSYGDGSGWYMTPWEVDQLGVYNEPLADVELVPDAGEHVPPAVLSWRGRRYEAGAVLEWWVGTIEWWNRPDVTLDTPLEVRWWRLEASSERGNGVVEISHEGARDLWIINRIVD